MEPGMAAARQAGLRYVSDLAPGHAGIVRRRREGGFGYFRTDGRQVRDAETLTRIRSLVIPPAWEEVWICADARGHLQATGRDAKGRKHFRYHPQWRAVRDATKFEHMRAFGAALPRVRRRLEQDIARPGLPPDKVLATVVALMERTLIRVGHEEYTRANHSYGLTTLRHRHVRIHGSKIQFKFRGKSGKLREIELQDRRLASILQRCQDLPGYELFHYVDAYGESHRIDADDVNQYLRRISGEEFTAKDFRTWAGSVLALMALRRTARGRGMTESKHNLAAAVKAVAGNLGNTPAVCRKCYIHPAVMDAYLTGDLPPGPGSVNFRHAEHALLKMLARKSKPGAASRRRARRHAGARAHQIVA